MLWFNGGVMEIIKFVNIWDLFELKYIGFVEFEVKILFVCFNSVNEVIVVDKIEFVSIKLCNKFDKIVYIGCGFCLCVFL